MASRFLKPMSERVREAREVVEFADQILAAKGGNAKAAKNAGPLEERDAKIRAEFHRLIAEGSARKDAVGKLAGDFKRSKSRINRILSSI
jgi:hypothetical protein